MDEGYPRPSNGFLRVTCTGGMNTSYSISTTDSLPFDIDSSTGDLSVTEDLDYDTGIISYSFTVICSERDSPDLNDTATVEIVLLPVNEFRPQVVGTSNVFVSVPEDTPMGTVIVSNSDTALPGTLSEYTITDNDAGIDGLLTFISTELDTKFFSLELNTGSVVLIRELDLDNQTDPAPANFEAVSVTGCDFFPPIETCPNVNLRIFVLQVNEFTPQFTQDLYTTSIPEDTPEGTEVLVVECTDGDVGVGTFAGIELYNASQAVVDAFAIDGSNGNITVRAVNYETDRSYEFMVHCLDTGGLEDFAEVTINIDFTPQFSQDSYNTSIPEDTPEGTEVLVVECTDGDVGVGEFAGIELYNASQAVVDAFAIDGSNGNITVRAVNYETDRSYEFMVHCLDTGGLEDFAEVTINIDFTPQFSQDGYNTSIPEDTPEGTEVLVVECTDGDVGVGEFAGIELYNASQAVVDAFAIDGSNGNITVRAVNYETDRSYEFMVHCLDTGGLEDFAEVTINIDFTPQFSQDSYNTSIPEDTPEGTEVLVVECTDGDVGVGQFAGIELYNASQAVMDAFAIDGSNGNITVRAVNYETDQSYEFMVRCIDTSGLEGFAEVTINIEDINDNSPICDTGNVPTTLSVRTYSSTALFTLTCSDLDSGQNGQLSYNISISSTIPSSGGTFEIDSMGVVTFTGTAEEGTYTITIRVSNPDGLYTEYEITLTVMSEEEDGSGGAVPFAAIIVPIIVILLIVTFIIVLIIIILYLRKRRKDAKK